mgnify:CR=1 FL=1
MKKLLLSLCAVLMTAVSYAEKTVTFDATADYTADAGTLTLEKDGVSITISGGTLANQTDYRFYKGQTGTFSSTVGNIKKIIFTCTASGTTKYGPGCFTVGDGTYSYEGTTGTWEGSSTEVVFTASSNQVRATKIEVTVDDSNNTYSVEAPTFSLTSGSYKDTQKVTITAPEGYGIIYTTDGSKPVEGNGIAVTANTVDVEISSTTTLKAIAVDNNDPDIQSAASSLVITIYHELGSLESPCTVKEALDFIKAGENLDSYFVFTKGTVSSIENFGNTATYWIKSDNGEDSLEVYSGYALGNVAFSDVSELGVGDVVTVYGKLTLYKTTYEYTYNNYIVAHDKSGREGTLEQLSPITLADFTNGGFENWTNGEADFWKSTTTASSATISLSTDAYSGSSSVMIQGATNNVRLATTEISLDAGYYLITFYAKAVDANAQVRPGYVKATLNDTKTSYTLSSYKYVSDAITVSNEWTKVEKAFQLEEDATVSLVIMNPKDQGNVLVDEFSLTPTTEDAMAISTVSESNTNNAVFNLAGQKVNANYNGIVIVNGKKILQK